MLLLIGELVFTLYLVILNFSVCHLRVRFRLVSQSFANGTLDNTGYFCWSGLATSGMTSGCFVSAHDSHRVRVYYVNADYTDD